MSRRTFAGVVRVSVQLIPGSNNRALDPLDPPMVPDGAPCDRPPAYSYVAPEPTIEMGVPG